MMISTSARLGKSGILSRLLMLCQERILQMDKHREKLIELLEPWLAHLSLCAANDLIANGVTFATGTDEAKEIVDQMPTVTKTGLQKVRMQNDRQRKTD
jgi:hypothetical protein